MELRIKTLMNEGYRILLFGEDFNFINIKGKIVSKELSDEMISVYKWLKS